MNSVQNESMGQSVSVDLNKFFEVLPDSDIDPEGTYKYVLIQAKLAKQVKYFVRGYKKCPYHANVFNEFMDEVENHNFNVQSLEDGHFTIQLEQSNQKIDVTCPGGGRIKHTPGESILVYGYSQAFGQPKHEISVNILKQQYPTYTSIEWSNDGY